MARAGQFREQIQLILPGAKVPDGIGGWVSSSAGQQVNVWAKIQEQKGAQVLALGQEITKEVFKISIRYQAIVAGADRIQWGAKSLKILSQAQDEKRTEIVIYAVNGR